MFTRSIKTAFLVLSIGLLLSCDDEKPEEKKRDRQPYHQYQEDAQPDSNSTNRPDPVHRRENDRDVSSRTETHKPAVPGPTGVDAPSKDVSESTPGPQDPPELATDARSTLWQLVKLAQAGDEESIRAVELHISEQGVCWGYDQQDLDSGKRMAGHSWVRMPHLRSRLLASLSDIAQFGSAEDVRCGELSCEIRFSHFQTEMRFRMPEAPEQPILLVGIFESEALVSEEREVQIEATHRQWLAEINAVFSGAPPRDTVPKAESHPTLPMSQPPQETTELTKAAFGALREAILAPGDCRDFGTAPLDTERGVRFSTDTYSLVDGTRLIENEWVVGLEPLCQRLREYRALPLDTVVCHELTCLIQDLDLVHELFFLHDPAENRLFLVAMFKSDSMPTDDRVEQLEQSRNTLLENVLSHYAERLDGVADPREVNCGQIESDCRSKCMTAVVMEQCLEQCKQEHGPSCQ